jgi:hypothetical protein
VFYTSLISPYLRLERQRIKGCSSPFPSSIGGLSNLKVLKYVHFVAFFLQKRLEIVNIKSMLARLECAMNRTDLFEEMLLLPKPVDQESNSEQSVNLVVGYNASPQSQTALDLTLLIAHQSRLAAQKPVTVQVVYVMAASIPSSNVFNSTHIDNSSIQKFSRQSVASSRSSKSATSVLTKPKSERLLDSSCKTVDSNQAIAAQSESYKQAARILCQARYLAEEWQGDFQTHLRVGDVTTQLKAVVESTSATALFLGCDHASHGIIQQCGDNFPCSVLGIPSELN